MRFKSGHHCLRELAARIGGGHDEGGFRDSVEGLSKYMKKGRWPVLF